MKTLTIKDLARTEQLDASAMSRVRGGMSLAMPSITYAPYSDSSVTATQNLAQYQTAFNVTADGSAFLDHIDVSNTNDQFAQNNIYVSKPYAYE